MIGARRLALAWTLACATASTVWIVTSSSRLGATFDEPVYVTVGLDRWRHGGIGGLMRLGTMPLAVDVVTLPVWMAERARGNRYALASDDRGRVVDARDLVRVLPLARVGTLIFWWLLLFNTARLAFRLGGLPGAAIAVIWLAAEPSMLAHGALATTDIALTAMLMGFAASWLTRVSDRKSDRLPRATDRSHWLRPGLWFGLAILAKASATVFAPVIAFAFEWSRGGFDWRQFATRAARVSGVAIVLVFLYCGSDWRTEDSFIAWARSLPAGPFATVMSAVAEHLPIFSNAGEGIVQQIKHNVRGHDAYLLGEVHQRAVWFYFPMVTLIKVNGALLAGVVTAFVLARSALWNPPMIAAVGLLALSPLFRVQTGIRMILPVVALGVVGVAAALAHIATGHDRRRHAATALVAILTAWSLSSARRSWPDAIVFANEFWGGSSRAYRFVSDSNYDWGQGLPALRQHLSDATGPIDLWYWGSDPDARTTPFRSFDVRTGVPADEAALRAHLHGRTLAVSATLLYGSALSPAARVTDADRRAVETAEILRRVLHDWPSERIGTFFVYRF